MIYTEDVIRLNEAAANFSQILDAFRGGETDPEGQDIPEATVSAFAREALAQAATIDGPAGMPLGHLKLVRPIMAHEIAGLIAAIRAVAPTHDRPMSWMDADGEAIGRLYNAIERIDLAIEAAVDRAFSFGE